MVCVGLGGHNRGRVSASPEESMAMGPERSKPLHNFTLPCLKWGNQRYLRCMKVTSAADTDANTAGDRRYPVMRSDNSTATRKRESETEKKRMRISKSRIDGDGAEDGIEAVREKIMFDLKTAADKMKDAILRKEVREENDDDDDDNDEDDEEREPPASSSALPPPPPPPASAEARPWNLRTRRAACKAPIIAGGSGTGKAPIIHSPSRTDVVAVAGNLKSPKLRVSPERRKLSVSLSKKEIEEDFMEMIGHRPPRRPKKRHRNVQKDLDTLFPGLWLTEVTLDAYKVPEAPDNGKR